MAEGKLHEGNVLRELIKSSGLGPGHQDVANKAIASLEHQVIAATMSVPDPGFEPGWRQS